MKAHTAQVASGPPEWLVMAIGIPVGSLMVALFLIIGGRNVRAWWKHGRHYKRMHRDFMKKQRRAD